LSFSLKIPCSMSMWQHLEVPVLVAAFMPYLSDCLYCNKQINRFFTVFISV
jgi:hypothetical protein